jgi:hypothetical protein
MATLLFWSLNYFSFHLGPLYYIFVNHFGLSVNFNPKCIKCINIVNVHHKFQYFFNLTHLIFLPKSEPSDLISLCNLIVNHQTPNFISSFSSLAFINFIILFINIHHHLHIKNSENQNPKFFFL